MSISLPSSDAVLVPVSKAALPTPVVVRGKSNEDIVRLLDLSGSLLDRDPLTADKHASAAVALARSRQDIALLARSLEYAGRSKTMLGAIDVGLSCYIEAMDLYIQLSDADGRARVYYGMARARSMRGEHSIAIDRLRSCISLCESAGARLVSLRADALQALGGLFGKLGDESAALDSLLSALRLSRAEEDRARIGRILNEMGVIYGRLEQFDQALATFKEALAIAREHGLRREEQVALLNCGIVHERLGRFNEAFELLGEARKIAEEVQDIRGAAQIDIKIGVVHMGLNDYSTSAEWSRRAEEALVRVGDTHNALIASINLAYACCALGRNEEALEVLNRLHRESAAGDEKESLLAVLNALAVVHERLGNLPETIASLRQAAAVRQELFSRERVHALSELQVRFELERAQHEREVYRTRNENLKRTLEHKTNDLAANALFMAQRTDFLSQLRRIILERGTEGAAAAQATLDELLVMIDQQLDPQQNWEAFESQFRQVHHRFIQTLAERYPLLTPTEQKICSLLKLNLSNRDIAQLMSVSLHNVEMHRYRLRKKLGLATGDNLSSFLLSI